MRAKAPRSAAAAVDGTRRRGAPPRQRDERVRLVLVLVPRLEHDVIRRAPQRAPRPPPLPPPTARRTPGGGAVRGADRRVAERAAAARAAAARGRRSSFSRASTSESEASWASPPASSRAGTRRACVARDAAQDSHCRAALTVGGLGGGADGAQPDGARRAEGAGRRSGLVPPLEQHQRGGTRCRAAGPPPRVVPHDASGHRPPRRRRRRRPTRRRPQSGAAAASPRPRTPARRTRRGGGERRRGGARRAAQARHDGVRLASRRHEARMNLALRDGSSPPARASMAGASHRHARVAPPSRRTTISVSGCCRAAALSRCASATVTVARRGARSTHCALHAQRGAASGPPRASTPTSATSAAAHRRRCTR